MKLKFVDQPYQTEAVNAICDIFEGCEVKDSLFTIDQSTKYEGTLIAEDETFLYSLGHGNRLSIPGQIVFTCYKYPKFAIIQIWTQNWIA